MTAMQSKVSADTESDLITRKSSVPVLGEGFVEKTPLSGLSTATDEDDRNTVEDTEQDPKTGKRRFWHLGKKKDEKGLKKADSEATTSSSALRSTSPMPSPANRGSSPQLRQAFGAAPSSPGRNIHSASPRLASPASSQIFERSVQEDIPAAATSPAIPSHITTENHIPPVLDASSMAITDDHLNPDTVEIITHAAHQPASVTVTGATSFPIPETPISPFSPDESHHNLLDNDDNASNYGSLDSADVRRLSFISFADVVHAEHAADHGSMRDSLLLSGASSIVSPPPGARSPSPIRSPASPPLSSSLSGSPSFRAVESSPNRGGKLPGSPRVGHGGSPPMVTGDLAIETMRQALRKTGSGDLSGFKGSVAGADEDNVGELPGDARSGQTSKESV